MANEIEAIRRGLVAQIRSAKKELAETRATFRNQKKHDRLAEAREAIERIRQIGMESYVDYTRFVKEGYWSWAGISTDKYVYRYDRTIVGYDPEKDVFVIKKGGRDICRSEGKEWVEDSFCKDKEKPISANRFKTIQKRVRPSAFVNILRKVEKGNQDLQLFNEGKLVEVSEEVARAVIADRRKRGLFRELLGYEELKYVPSYSGYPLLHTLDYLTKSDDCKTVKFVEERRDFPLVYFATNGVFIEYFREQLYTNERGECKQVPDKVVLYGAEKNTGDLVNRIKGENTFVFGSGF